MIARLLYLVGGLIELLIGLRFLLRLIGANPNNAFVEWVYNWSTPFVAPFSGILGQNATITGQGAVTTSVVDWAALIAFVVIGLVVGIIGRVASTRRAV